MNGCSGSMPRRLCRIAVWPVFARCEGGGRIDVPGPLLPFGRRSMMLCGFTEPAIRGLRSNPNKGGTR
jgi:hypothetical protein